MSEYVQPQRRAIKRKRTTCSTCTRDRLSCEPSSAPPACARCLTAGTSCSLSTPDASPASQSTPAHVATAIVPVPACTIADIEARTARIESMLTEVLGRSRYPRVSRDIDRTIGRPLGTGITSHSSMGSAAMVDSTLGVSIRAPFIDPAAAGLATTLELAQAHKRCVTSLARIAPIPAPLDPAVAPTHPFLACCVLYYASCAGPALQQHAELSHAIETQLARASSGVYPPSRSLVAGLSVLALSPPDIGDGSNDPSDSHAVDPRLLSPSRAHAIALRASEVARQLGLDEVALRFQPEDIHELKRPWAADMLRSMCLWYGTAHRAAWAEILTSASFSSSPTRSPALCTLIPTSHALLLDIPDLVHLTLESELLGLIAPVSDALASVKRMRIFDPAIIEALYVVFDNFSAQLHRWRADVMNSGVVTAEYLCLTSYFIQLYASIKLSDEAGTLLPSPLGHERRLPAVMRFGGILLRRAQDIICFVVEAVAAGRLELATLPGSFTLILFLPLGSMIQFGKLNTAIEPLTENYTFTLDALIAYKQLVKEIHPAGPEIVKRIEGAKAPAGWPEARVDIDAERARADAAAAVEQPSTDVWPIDLDIGWLTSLGPSQLNEYMYDSWLPFG